MSKNALRTCYKLATIFFESGVRGRNFEQFKTLAPNSRLTYELQEVSTNYKIQLRTSRIEYDSAAIPKIYRFVAIRGGSGHSGIPPYQRTTTELPPWKVSNKLLGGGGGLNMFYGTNLP